MSEDDLKQILVLGQNLLEENKAIMTPDLIADLQELIPLFQAVKASVGLAVQDVHCLALYQKIATMDLSKVVAFLTTVVTTENQLQAGLGDKLIASSIKLQNRQFELELLAKLF